MARPRVFPTGTDREPGDVSRGRSGPPLTPLAVTAAFVLGYLVVGLMSLWGASSAPPQSTVTGSPWLNVWIRYDSDWYLGIAQNGYYFATDRQSPVAFFPAYPMVVRLLAPVLGGPELAGHLVTVGCGWGSTLLFARWVRPRLGGPARWTSVALLLLYPYAVFLYGAVYGDALFLVCVLGAFTLLERRRYWAAGALAAVATAGRPVGVAIAVGLVVRMLELRAQDAAASDRPPGPAAPTPPSPGPALSALWRQVPALRARHYLVLLSLGGIGGWCLWLWSTYGDPLAFLTAEATWAQGAGPKTWSKVAFFGALVKAPLSIRIVLLAQAVVTVLAVLAMRQVWRRFGWGYLAYCLVVLGIPVLGTKDFLGCGRYIIAAFPVLAAGAGWLADSGRARWVRPVALTASGTGMLVASYYFGQGILIS